MGDECNCPTVWTFFSTALLGNWDENWPFPVLWPRLGLADLLTYWVQHLRASSLSVMNSSTGIPLHPLALLTAVLPQACLTSHSSMSGSGWLTTSSWIASSLLYSSSLYSFYLFLISSASTRSQPFLSFIVPIFGKNVPLIFPIFLKRSLVFPLLLFSSIFYALFIEEGLLVSPYYSLSFNRCYQVACLKS